MINSFLYATKLRKYLHCPAGGLPRPRRGICSEECESNLPRLWRYSRSTASIPLSTHVDLSSTCLHPIILVRSPNIHVRGRRKSPTAPRLFFVRIGASFLLLPFWRSSGSHTVETEGSSYLCRVLDSVLANYIERDEKNRLNL